MRRRLFDCARRFQSIHLRHREVKQRNIGKRLLSNLHGFAPIRCLAADFPAWMLLQRLPQATAEHFVIIGDQNTYHKSFPLSLVGYLSCVLANSSFRRKRFSASSGAKKNPLRYIPEGRSKRPPAKSVAQRQLHTRRLAAQPFLVVVVGMAAARIAKAARHETTGVRVLI